MVRVVVVVIVVPNVDSVAAVFVGPLDLGLEVGPFAVFIALDGVVGISAPISKVPCVWVGHASVPVE